jgi:hypothetical protein
MKFKTAPAIFLIVSWFAGNLQAQQQVSFTNQSSLLNAVTGFTFSNCAVDMNGDFLDDVVRVSNTALIIDFQQPGGTFQQKIFPYNFQNQPGWSICAGDLDNNGFNDLLFGGGEKVSFVMANADGTAYSEAVDPAFIFSQRSTLSDIDNDGGLDAFVCHDLDQSHPYRNDGFGNMTLDQTLIQTSPLSGNYSAIWTDYDNDGDTDLYVTKCKGGAPPGDPARTNLLYRNNGDGTFTEAGAEAGLADNAQSWSTVFEDFDNDGDFDAFIVNHDFQNRLFRNNGDGTFTDVIAGSGIDANDLGAWENASGDFNNDGYMDIFSELTNRLYLGNGDLTFTGQNIPATPGGTGDFNNDGFLDIIQGNQLWINDGNGNNWLKINTIGTLSNRNGIGARVEIYGSSGVQVREVRSGQSFSPMSSLTVFFGLGQADHVDLAVVKWPSGIVTTVENPAINSTLNIPEAGCLLPPSTLEVSGEPDICPGDSVQLTAPEGFSYAWTNGDTSQSITVFEAGNFSAILMDSAGCVSFTNSVAVSIIQDLPPSITVDGSLIFCEGDTVTLTSSTGENYFWSNGQPGQSLAVTESGSYTVAVDAQCSAEQLVSDPIAVEVLAAPKPVISDIVISQGDSVLLTASGENPAWYDAPSGGNLLATGPEFQTPPLDQTVTYFVESHNFYPGEIQSGGKPDNSGGGGLPSQGAYTFFNVWEPFTLLSVTVYVPDEAPAGQRTFQLVNENEAVLAEATVDLGHGQFEVALDFEVPVGSWLSLRCPQNNLFRNNAGVQYPYPIGDVGEMTTSYFGDSYYYYFYNWKIQQENFECVSERAPVTVGVTPVDYEDQTPALIVYPNPAQDAVFVFLKHTGPAEASLRLFDVAGREVLTKIATENQTIRIDSAKLAAGIYYLQCITDERIFVLKIVVE